MSKSELVANRDPAISVLMPVYNGERYVAEATESILAQTWADFEFVIVDDGSTDRSRSILEGYAARDPRIRLISRPNTGIIGALNDGLAVARGELVARMDADDVAVPHRFERQFRYMAEHPECVAVGSRVMIIDPDGDPLAVMTDMITHEQIERGLLAGVGAAIYHPAVMYRKSVVLEIGAYRDIFDESEDMDLFLRLAEVGRLANIEEPLLKYREHMAKASKAKVGRVILNARRILEEAYQRRGLTIPEDLFATAHDHFRSLDIHRTWAWWALGAGHVASARKHAMAGLTQAPFSPDSWRLLFCTIRGR